MAEYVNGTTDIVGGSVIRYALNTTTPNQAVIRKIIAGNGITITSTGVDAGTGDVTISVDINGSGGSGGGTGGGGTGGGGGTSTGLGTVTSVNMTVPQGLTVLGAPITTAGTLAVQLSSGYTIPLYVDVQKGVDAYNNAIMSLSYSTSTGIITLTQRDGDSMIATITLNPFTTSNLAEGTNLYYTDARARGAISLTTTGTSGAATYNSTTGVLNIPQYSGTNIYNSDGTLTADRTVTHSIYSLTFAAGTSSRLHANGNWTIGGISDANYKFDVQGTFRTSNYAYINYDGFDGLYIDKTRIFRNYYGNTFGRIDFTGYTTLFQSTVGVRVAGWEATGDSLNIIRDQAANRNVVYIGSTYSNANRSASFIVDSTTRGAMLPRMTATQRQQIGGVPLTITSLVGGSGYPNGTYTNVQVQGGGGFNMTLNVTISGGSVTSVSYNTTGDGYRTGDVITFYYLSSLGLSGGTGFSFTVGSVSIPSGVLAYQIDAIEGQYVYTSAGWKRFLTEADSVGTVTQVSVATANGFAGTVANNTTTPAITLSTTITGILKGNGTAISAAVVGTDYQAPITLTTTGNSGPATFVGSTLNIPVYTNITDGLVSGGIVTWSGTGFIYDVSAAYYYLGGVYYTTSNTQVTLGAADISNPRIDIVAVNNLGQVIVIAGVPGSNPVKAQIDPTTQIELATILVPAGATSPVNILTAILYDEVVNSTWSSLASGVTVDFANTTTPYTGSVTASVNATTTGTRFIQFTRISGTDSISNYSVFKFAIRLGSAWTSTSTLAIGFYNNNTLISTEVSVLNGAYGFNSATTATYQLIQIPIANWRFTQATFNRVRLRFINSLPAFRLDRVELQAGVVQTLVQANNIYTSDGSLAGIRTLTLNGNYLDIVGSSSTTRFNSDGSLNIGGTVTATTLASGSDKLVIASATGVLSTATIGSGLSYSGGILTATGTLTSASFQTDYDDTVTGLRNSVNTVYTTSQNFVSGSTRVFVNGVRQSRGGSYDYTETAANQITFNYAPDSGDLIVIDYIKS
jgi:hypothetical protein